MYNSRSKAFLMATMVAAMSNHESNHFHLIDDHEPLEIQPRPPKGTKEYFFNGLGVYSTESMLKTETVFKCHASNKKNALRKFNKWRLNSL
jgi:hypothetical protein